MSYDSDHTLYVTAFSMAGAAAIVLPYARPISFMMGLMIADPADMQRAAAQWNDKSPVDIGPAPTTFTASSAQFHPPMAAPSGGDIDYLRQELGRLARTVGVNKEWVGASYDMFMKTFKEFDDQLLLLENRRKGVGDSLDSAAEIYHWGAVICMSIAGTLMALAAFVTAARFIPPIAVGAETTAMSIVARIGLFLRQVLSTHMKVIWKVTGIVAGVAVLYNQQSQSLPGMKAMKGETPEFTQALSYEPASGGLAPVLPKVDTDIEQPSMFPDFGW
ncbi:hypothetical protein SAMN05216276_101670 [Streptosporangium subroseum]|uniref:WXG100 family type VII secretion target n=1 Tax=Streptosporangium subroseum TaxID=106412 RepID=A0A239HET7_9ACTN|nr:hypothetical protein [Streptosporangium subroseum]SNS79333.1 hypothetical protein SAMN05216276_101670 [Streptosporangium subroseum]